MAKKILDNCTIYRLLDGMSMDTQRTLVLNALRNCKEEIETNKDLKTQEYAKLLSLLSEGVLDMKKITECLISLSYFKEEIIACEREIKNAEARKSYLDGEISLHEMQTIIHDTMEEAEGEFYPIEYNYRLLNLLSIDPLEIDIKEIEYIRKLKEKSLEAKLNLPIWKYPN